jgi:hypothetical protein
MKISQLLTITTYIQLQNGVGVYINDIWHYKKTAIQFY